MNPLSTRFVPGINNYPTRFGQADAPAAKRSCFDAPFVYTDTVTLASASLDKPCYPAGAQPGDKRMAVTPRQVLSALKACQEAGFNHILNIVNDNNQGIMVRLKLMKPLPMPDIRNFSISQRELTQVLSQEGHSLSASHGALNVAIEKGLVNAWRTMDDDMRCYRLTDTGWTITGKHDAQPAAVPARMRQVLAEQPHTSPFLTRTHTFASAMK